MLELRCECQQEQLPELVHYDIGHTKWQVSRDCARRRRVLCRDDEYFFFLALCPTQGGPGVPYPATGQILFARLWELYKGDLFWADAWQAQSGRYRVHEFSTRRCEARAQFERAIEKCRHTTVDEDDSEYCYSYIEVLVRVTTFSYVPTSPVCEGE